MSHEFMGMAEDSRTFSSYSNCPNCGQPVIGGQFSCGHSPSDVATRAANPIHWRRRTETGWLAETIINGRPVWVKSADGNQCTADASEAIRFSRKEDAERFINTLIAALRPLLTATEHSWG